MKWTWIVYTTSIGLKLRLTGNTMNSCTSFFLFYLEKYHKMTSYVNSINTKPKSILYYANRSIRLGGLVIKSKRRNTVMFDIQSCIVTFSRYTSWFSVLKYLVLLTDLHFIEVFTWIKEYRWVYSVIWIFEYS